MQHTDEIADLCAALAAFGADVTNPPQSKTAQVQTRNGGSYSYSYADLGDVLSHIRPALGRNGLAVTQEVVVHRDHVTVQTLVLHATGQRLRFEPFALPLAEDFTPQTIGGVITYARRYSLLAALNLATDADDDAAHASGRQASQGAAQAPRSSSGGSTTRKATEKQIAKIHAIAKEAGVSDDQLHAGAKRDHGVDSLKELTTKQASELIDKLGHLPPAEPKQGVQVNQETGEIEEPPGHDAESFRESRGLSAVPDPDDDIPFGDA